MNKNALDILQHTSIRNIEYILQNLDLNYVTSGIRKAVKRSLELVIKQTTDIEEKNEVILLQYEFSKTTYKQGYINKKTKVRVKNILLQIRQFFNAKSTFESYYRKKSLFLSLKILLQISK